MPYIKKNEERVYHAVLRGDMEIDASGRIWRVAKRGWDRWKKTTVSRPCKRVRAERQIATGYLHVRAMLGGVRHTAYAHRLVWMHVNGPIPDGLVMNHKNGIKSDNRPSNLEVVTPSENQKHAIHVLKVGTFVDQWGEKNHAAKLTDSQVREIRRRRATGERLIPIAKDFGVAFQTVSRIARGDRRRRCRG